MRTFEALDAYRSWFLATGLVLPAVAVVIGLVFTVIAPIMFAFSGLCAFAAGWAWKFIVVTRAGFNQGFAINRIPVRGAGIAGAMVKPGWVLP